MKSAKTVIMFLITIALFVGGAAAALANIQKPSAPAAAAPQKGTLHHFRIEIDGVTQGVFKEISGLESEVEIIEYRDGDSLIAAKRPGRPKFKNIILKRDMTQPDYFNEWFKAILEGKTDRKSGSIIYLDREGNELARFHIHNAWPCRWKAPELNSGYIVEEIEFVVEKVERAK